MLIRSPSDSTASPTGVVGPERMTGLRSRFGVGRRALVDEQAGVRVVRGDPRGQHAGKADQRRVIFLARRGREPGVHGPVFARLEGLNLHLALNDQAQRTVLCKDPFRSVDERVKRLIAGM